MLDIFFMKPEKNGFFRVFRVRIGYEEPDFFGFSGFDWVWVRKTRIHTQNPGIFRVPVYAFRYQVPLLSL